MDIYKIFNLWFCGLFNDKTDHRTRGFFIYKNYMVFLFVIFKFNWCTICIEHYKLREHLNVTCRDQSMCDQMSWSTHHEHFFCFLWSFDPQYLCEDLSPIFHTKCDSMTSTKIRHSFHAKLHIQVILLTLAIGDALRAASQQCWVCDGAKIISHIQV
jgi:hypothetical protein